jgi:UDP-N-acetylmuramoyl-L-alanyl-D-glutamate--2,6-diaminopimelate ligase
MSGLRLIDLLIHYGLPADLEEETKALQISGVTSDSRQVKPGMAFVALAGAKEDGARFIPDALARGASVIIVNRESWNMHRDLLSTNYDPRTTVYLANPRLALSRFAATFYPGQPRHTVAITGTDGKTSTADFFRQLAMLLDHKAASMGTLGTLGEGRREIAPGTHTTPDPVALHQTLSKLAADGYTHLAMEASSHGLDQYRLDGIKIEAAAFTNITRDHLDYHVTDEAYFAAKARLFSQVLEPRRTAVLNADDAHFPELHDIVIKRRLRLLTYGHDASDLVIEHTAPHEHGQRAEVNILGRNYVFDLPHAGAFQVYNMLAAAGLLIGLGEDPQAVAELIPELQGVPGRLERVADSIYIDYAHTPAALAGALRVLRAHTGNRLIALFGCGGDRDKGKRPLMAKAASELADIVIVTDDNPRGEDPAQIRADALAGIPDSRRLAAKEVADRREAIYGAVRMLEEGDVLLVAGKGHERTQVIGTVAHPFDDAEVVREAIKEL